MFVDSTKAFDVIVRDILWYTFIQLGLRGHFFDIIKLIYEKYKTTCKVKNNNELKESFVCSLGVRQGESLSPFLLSMYLNDIEEYYFILILSMYLNDIEEYYFILKGFDGIDI